MLIPIHGGAPHGIYDFQLHYYRFDLRCAECLARPVCFFYRKTDFSGLRAFIVSSAASAVYTFAFALELSGNSMDQIKFWIKLEYLGMPYIAPSSLLMIMHFVGLEKLVSKKTAGPPLLRPRDLHGACLDQRLPSPVL
ncbi:histidine kinase N-terminal 7TM domain-containing protein [Paenibacillus rhizoplanae]